MPDKTKDLLTRLSQATPRPSPILITSPDRIRRERAALFLAQGKSASSSKSKPAPSSTEIVKRRGHDMNAEKLHAMLDDASSLSLFSAARSFLLLDLHDLNAELQKMFANRIGRLSGEVSLIITSEPLPQSNPLRKLCDKSDSCVEFEELKKFDFRRWLERELARAGIVKYSPQALETIIAVSDESPDLAAAMVEQLSLYLEEGRPLTHEDIQNLFIASASSNDFEFVDLIASGHPEKARRKAAELLREGKSPFMLLALLSKNFSNYFGIQSARESGLNSAQVRTRLAVPPWLFSKQERLSDLRTRAEYIDSFRALLRADSRLKNRSLGANEIFFELCDELVHSR